MAAAVMATAAAAGSVDNAFTIDITRENDEVRTKSVSCPRIKRGCLALLGFSFVTHS